MAGAFILDVPANTLRHVLLETSCIQALHWHADSRRLLMTARPGWVGVGPGLRVWDAQNGKPLGPFQAGVRAYLGIEATWRAGAEPEILACEEKPRALVRRSADGAVVLGRTPLPSLRLVQFSPDGGRLAAGVSPNTVQQWDTRTGQVLGPLLRHANAIQFLRYSPDGKLLAVACVDGSVRVWDADSGWALGPPFQHLDAPVSVAFADDNRTLRTLTESGLVRTWPIPQPIDDDPVRFTTWLLARCGLRVEGEEPIQGGLEAWQQACGTLAERWPQPDPALAEASDDLTARHWVRAQDAAAAGSDRGELYHLERLATSSPENRAVQARIARVHARVAGLLPASEAREHEWRLAAEAAMKQGDWPGKEFWLRFGVVDATARGTGRLARQGVLAPLRSRRRHGARRCGRGKLVSRPSDSLGSGQQ